MPAPALSGLLPAQRHSAVLALQSALGNAATSIVVQRNGGSPLATASGQLRKQGGGPVTNATDSTFVLTLDAPPDGKHRFYRWSARDAGDHAYLMRSSADDRVVQYYGTSTSAYLPAGSLQAMFDGRAGAGCRVLCRVLERDNPATPTYAENRGTAGTRVFTAPFAFQPNPQEYRRTPQDLSAVAWSGDIDMVTWAAAAVRVGEIQVTSVDALVTEIEGAMSSDRHYLRTLTVAGHGYSGNMSPNLNSIAISGPARGALLRLRPLFGPGSRVRLDGCEVAQGPVGRRFIQQLADLLDVPVVAQTSYVHAFDWYTLGIEETARPGETLGSDAEIVADQVHRAITETTVITARIVVKQLEHAKAMGLQDDVVAALRRGGRWATVRGRLDFWQATAVVPWIGEPASISTRIGRLGILRHPLEAPAEAAAP